MKKIFSKPVSWLVLFLVALLLWSISKEAPAETIMELAPASVFVGGDYVDGQSTVMMHERWHDKYSVGIVLLVDINDRDQGNTGLELLRVSRYKRMEVGLGYTFWSDSSAAWDTDRTFSLMVGWRITDRTAIRIRHWSTGGTSPLNSGLDMLTIGRSFGH